MSRVGGQSVGEVDHRARPRAGHRTPLGQPGFGAAQASQEPVAVLGRDASALEGSRISDQGEGRPGGAELPGHAHQVPGAGAVASNQVPLVVGPSHDRDPHDEHR